jgi:lysophospholipase L1-like esterase
MDSRGSHYPWWRASSRARLFKRHPSTPPSPKRSRADSRFCQRRLGESGKQGGCHAPLSVTALNYGLPNEEADPSTRHHLMAKLSLLRQVLLTGSLLTLGCASSGGDPSSDGSEGGSGGSSAGPVAGASGAANPAGGTTGVGGALGLGGSPVAMAGSSGNGGASGGVAGLAEGGGAGGSVSTGGANSSGGSLGTSGGAGAGGVVSSGGATQMPPSGKITVWLAGDSTMANGGANCPVGWGKQFQALFGPNATVVNNAAGGTTIQTWLYGSNVTTQVGPDKECVVSPKTYATRWQQMLDGMKAGDYLLVEFGINDGSTCADGGRHVGSALFQADYVYMATAAKMKGAQAIFLTSTSTADCTGAAVKPNRGFQAETMAAATMAGTPIIQLTQLSAALYTSLGLCPNDGNYASTTSAVGKFFCADHTHFETAGAAQIAGVVAKALRDQKIGLAAYLK